MKYKIHCCSVLMMFLIVVSDREIIMKQDEIRLKGYWGIFEVEYSTLQNMYYVTRNWKKIYFVKQVRC